jgi:hypothetical protein
MVTNARAVTFVFLDSQMGLVRLVGAVLLNGEKLKTKQNIYIVGSPEDCKPYFYHRENLIFHANEIYLWKFI